MVQAAQSPGGLGNVWGDLNFPLLKMGSHWQGVSSGGDSMTYTNQVVAEICMSTIVQL